jgi:LuxR family maltose regulon positive regulatory protein
LLSLYNVSMASRLLQTKLTVPPRRSDYTPRLHLAERLTQGLAGKLTLVSAPAGYGKTTLVANWGRQLIQSTDSATSGTVQQFCWLSLDEADNDPARFLNYLLATLRQVDSQIGSGIPSIQQSSQPLPSQVILSEIINDIAKRSSPVANIILALDDYHLIINQDIHQALAFLLERQPLQLHLMILTREDPPLPLARLRARRELMELRLADLRFSVMETAVLLNGSMNLNLTPEQIEALEARTEGWISGLQLAALSLKTQSDVAGFVRSFAGSNRYILDYLMDEVFRQQPAEMQEFLLKTSILERFNASLCDAVCATGDNGRLPHDSRRTLLTLEQANLFLVPLDEARQWYRYHHLFDDILRQSTIRSIYTGGLAAGIWIMVILLRPSATLSLPPIGHMPLIYWWNITINS